MFLIKKYLPLSFIVSTCILCVLSFDTLAFSKFDIHAVFAIFIVAGKVALTMAAILLLSSMRDEIALVKSSALILAIIFIPLLWLAS